GCIPRRPRDRAGAAAQPGRAAPRRRALPAGRQHPRLPPRAGGGAHGGLRQRAARRAHPEADRRAGARQHPRLRPLRGDADGPGAARARGRGVRSRRAGLPARPGGGRRRRAIHLARPAWHGDRALHGRGGRAPRGPRRAAARPRRSGRHHRRRAGADRIFRRRNTLRGDAEPVSYPSGVSRPSHPASGSTPLRDRVAAARGASGTGASVFAVLLLFTLFAGDFWRNLISWPGYFVLAGALAVGSVVFLVRMRPAVRWRKLPKSLVLFLAFAIVSLAWSAYPGATALGLVTQLATTAAAVFLAFCLSWQALLTALANAFRWILGLSLLFELIVAIFVRKPVLPLTPVQPVPSGRL